MKEKELTKNEKKQAKIQRLDHQLDAISQQIEKMIEESINLKKTSETAKTKPKQLFYHKKLEKNNQKILGMMVTAKNLDILKEKELQQ